MQAALARRSQACTDVEPAVSVAGQCADALWSAPPVKAVVSPFPKYEGCGAPALSVGRH